MVRVQMQRMTKRFDNIIRCAKKEMNMTNIFTKSILLCSALSLVACGNATNKVAGSVGTGADQYTPAVDLQVSKKSEAQYAGDLAQCRQIAVLRQASEADRAGQRTLTNTIGSGAVGAVDGYAFGKSLKSIGASNIDSGDLAGIGLAVGVAGGLLGGLFSTNKVNDEGKRTVDACLENRGYVVYGI